MKYKLKLFAVLRDRTKLDHWEYESTHELSGSELLQAFFAAFPDLDGMRQVTRLAVNQAFCTQDPMLKPEDELALIPPVSGG